MDASRVLGTLRAHCDRLELELRELDADLEEAKAMVSKREKRGPPCKQKSEGGIAAGGRGGATEKKTAHDTLYPLHDTL